jgi:hypothetical protein
MYKKMILGLVLMGSLAGCHAKAEVNFPAVSARTLSFITGNAEVNAVFYGLGSTFCLLQAAGLSCSSLLDENFSSSADSCARTALIYGAVAALYYGLSRVTGATYDLLIEKYNLKPNTDMESLGLLAGLFGFKVLGSIPSRIESKYLNY